MPSVLQSVLEKMSGEEETALVVGEKAPAVVKETILKKRKRNDEWAAVRKERHDIAKAKARGRNEGTFKRAEEYVKQHRLQVRSSGADISLVFAFDRLFLCSAT